ncbi:MAG: hypothetical protein HGA53_11335, partial [Anaerolineaceae bacterium]|nr:hypothetical protein [Anaerolineaceae bacterium]
MKRISIQYLEDSPELVHLSPQKVGETLRTVMGKIPLKYLLIGWNLPAPLLDVCKTECQRAGSMLYRWHPLLTGDEI